MTTKHESEQDGTGTDRDVPQVRLTDRGLETPDRLIGQTGRVVVEKPDIKMTITYSGDGVKEIDRNLCTFPPTDCEPDYVPEGHIRVDGVLYEVVDDRELNECPECGSDKIPAGTEEPKCYDCDRPIDPSLVPKQVQESGA